MKDSEPRSILDYFDIRKIGHLSAYDEYRKTGDWPHGFTDGLVMPQGWETILTDRIANAWVHHAMEIGGLKVKLHQAKVRLMNLGLDNPEAQTAVAVMGEVEHTLLA